MPSQKTNPVYGEATITAMFRADELAGIDRSASVWRVADAFLRVSEGNAERIAQGSGGLLLLVAIPGKPCSGAFYLYQISSHTFFQISFEHRELFSPAMFEQVVRIYALGRLIEAPGRLDRKRFSRFSADAQSARRRLGQNGAAPAAHEPTRLAAAA